jgi:hypothetical protein
MVEMKMTEKNVGVYRLVSEFRLQFVSQETDAGSTVEDQDLVRIGPNFDARSVSAISQVFSLWRGGRAANSPKAYPHYGVPS